MTKNPTYQTKSLQILIFALLALLSASLLSPAQSPACWPNFRGDAMLTGVSNVTFPSGPSLLWNFKTSAAVKAPPVVCNNTIVVGSADGNVYGLAMDGKLKWKLNTENSVEAPALIVDDLAYIGNLQGKLFAIELSTGRVKWTYTADNMIMGSPNYYMHGNQKIIIIGSYDYFLHGVDAQTGQGLWKYEADNYINGAPSIYDGMAVFGGCDGLLHLVSAGNGKLISRFEIATYVASSAAIVENMAYVGDYDGSFSSLDIKNQKPKWVFRNEESKLPFIGSAAVEGNRIFIGNRDKFMYCLDKTTGKLLWKVNTGARVDASPVILKNGVLVANMRGDLLLMNKENGATLWSYELGTPISGNPAVIQDYIIVGAEDGRVYCFGR